MKRAHPVTLQPGLASYAPNNDFECGNALCYGYKARYPTRGKRSHIPQERRAHCTMCYHLYVVTHTRALIVSISWLDLHSLWLDLHTTFCPDTNVPH